MDPNPSAGGPMSANSGEIIYDEALVNLVDSQIRDHAIFVFSKSWCPFCDKAKSLLARHGLKYGSMDLDLVAHGAPAQKYLGIKTGQTTVPNIFINGVHVGGFSDLSNLNESGVLLDLVNGMSNEFQYDLVVIGGGSGGISAAKEAAKLGKKVALCDFVKPSPHGTSWGIGGTCVNAGCIPKKLMHRASIIKHDLIDAPYFGWNITNHETITYDHDWNTLVENVQNYIRSLNFGYRSQLAKLKISNFNASAEFIDKHNIVVTDKNKKQTNLNSRNFIIATGLRPRYPDIPNARELCITSDDLFSLNENPGETLIVGASYIALECAGFLRGCNINCTVMVRSIVLRGFDREMADKIETNLKQLGVNIVKPCVPVKISKNSNGLIDVVGEFSDGSESYTGSFKTVMFATGREPTTDELKLDNASVIVNTTNKKITVDESDRTSASNIFAVGDVADVNVELTPAAIKAGKLLVHRIFNASSLLMVYKNIPTTVFTPLEYGCVGLSEEDAKAQHGESNVEVYHNLFKPLESVLSQRFDQECFGKVVFLKNAKELTVVGIHVLGPNAGEIVQGYALAVTLGINKTQLDSIVGIHPTNAEVFTTMNISKSSGEVLSMSGC